MCFSIQKEDRACLMPSDKVASSTLWIQSRFDGINFTFGLETPACNALVFASFNTSATSSPSYTKGVPRKKKSGSFAKRSFSLSFTLTVSYHSSSVSLYFLLNLTWCSIGWIISSTTFFVLLSFFSFFVSTSTHSSLLLSSSPFFYKSWPAVSPSSPSFNPFSSSTSSSLFVSTSI